MGLWYLRHYKNTHVLFLWSVWIEKHQYWPILHFHIHTFTVPVPQPRMLQYWFSTNIPIRGTSSIASFGDSKEEVERRVIFICSWNYLGKLWHKMHAKSCILMYVAKAVALAYLEVSRRASTTLIGIDGTKEDGMRCTPWSWSRFGHVTDTKVDEEYGFNLKRDWSIREGPME